MSFEDKNFGRFITNSHPLIGKGSFGAVYGPCDWEGKKCAIKRLQKRDGEDQQRELAAYNKIIQLHHEHLIRVYDVSLEPHDIYTMMEYASGGSLEAALRACKSDLPLDIVKDWGIQIAEGMAYLHSKNIVHRDLKSPNIVIMEADASQNPYNKTLKITDFDLIRDHQGTRTMSFFGTIAWMAPEVRATQEFSKASDVYSFGVVLWEILTRQVPNVTITDVVAGSVKWEIPDTCPDIKYVLSKQKIASSTTTRTTRQQTQKHRAFLEEYMEPDFGLLHNLLARGIIVWREMDDVKSQISSCSRNSKLLDYILANDQTDGLIEALREEDQTHISNYLTANGEYSAEFVGGNWPLTANETSILSTNRRTLADLLELTNLLDRLNSAKVINRWQRDSISSKPTSYEKNNALLDILRRRSIRDYQKTIACLHQSQQYQIAEILQKGGVVIPVHAHLDEKNVTENEIVNRIAHILSNISIDASTGSRLLERVQSKVFGAKVGQSIVLYMYCHAIEELQQLKDLQISGKLKDYVELWFNTLLSRSKKVAVVAITINDEEFEMLQKFLKEESDRRGLKRKHSIDAEVNLEENEPMLSTEDEGIVSDQSNNKEELGSSTKDDSYSYAKPVKIKRRGEMEIIPSTNSSGMDESWTVTNLNSEEIGYTSGSGSVMGTEGRASETTLNQLPWELLDIVLEKSLLHWILKSSARQKESDKTIIKSLASVEFYWFKRMTKRRFKNRIWKRLKAFYATYMKRRAIVGNNRQYLLTHIQPSDELIDSLLSVNCIRKEHCHLTHRQRLKKPERRIRDKNSELLDVMRSCDHTKFSDFVGSFRQTNQKAISKIMKNGGAVIKVEIQNRAEKYTTSEKKTFGLLGRLHKEIEDFRCRTKPWSNQTGEFISFLNEESIEIVSSQLDGQTVIVWIWCRSQKALETIQMLYDTDKLLVAFWKFADIPEPSDELSQRMVVNIDRNQFERTVVCNLIHVSFSGRIDEETVRGVMKLRDEIYILCRSNVIRVYEDRIPFRFLEEIEMQEISYPTDLVSSEKNCCLYIADSWGKCVWMIMRDPDDQYKTINWLTTDYEPWTLSALVNGQLLVVCAASSKLMIYGSDAELIRSIQLPRDIKPYHATETSSGYFMVLHQWVEKEKESGIGGRETWVISELDSDGQTMTRRFSPLNEEQQLSDPKYLALDADDQVLVADQRKERVILLDSDLKWNRILCPTKEEEEQTKIHRPYRLCYDKTVKQLIVGGYLGNGINVYTLG